MKKLFTSVFFALTFLTVSASNDLKISAQATSIARQMLNEVQLNELEYIRVKAFTAEKLEKIAEIQKMYSNDAEMLASKMAEAENNYNHNLQSILNPGQFEKYLAFSAKISNTAVASSQE